jgi:hypothetical protein
VVLGEVSLETARADLPQENLALLGSQSSERTLEARLRTPPSVIPQMEIPCYGAALSSHRDCRARGKRKGSPDLLQAFPILETEI